MTQAEIARHFGISQSTVSRVLKHPDSTKFSKELRRSILDFCRSSAPEQLNTGHTFDIAFSAPENFRELPFFHQLFLGARQIAAELDYSLIFMPGSTLGSQLRRRKFDGIIASPDFTDMPQEYFGLPTVLLNRSMPDSSLDAVMPDSTAIVYLPVKYLTDRGFKKIAYFEFERSGYLHRNIMERRTAFLMFCEQFGLSKRWFRIHQIRYNHPEDQRNAFRKSFEEFRLRDGLPDAVLCHDSYYTELQSVLRENDLRVPEDIQVIGFDNLDQFAATPFLSSVDFDLMEMGRLAMRRLHERICRPDLPHLRISVQPRLILRGSVRGDAPRKAETPPPKAKKSHCPRESQVGNFFITNPET